MRAMTYDLGRFIGAQSAIYAAAVAELRGGRKQSHWMWFIFPQVAGLGFSEMSRRFAITSLDEARAYLDDPVLGPRLHECCEAMLATAGRSAQAILGPIDAVKLRSSMTLFHRADPEDRTFPEVLERFFDGLPDEATDRLLG